MVVRVSAEIHAANADQLGRQLRRDAVRLVQRAAGLDGSRPVVPRREGAWVSR